MWDKGDMINIIMDDKKYCYKPCRYLMALEEKCSKFNESVYMSTFTYKFVKCETCRKTEFVPPKD